MDYKKTTWVVPEKIPQLVEDAVHVWYVPETNFHTTEDYDCLSLEEQNQANRLISKVSRSTSIRSRAILKKLLGFYTRTSPKSISLQYQQHGKPFLSSHEVYFNLSHSNQVTLYAFSKNFRLGIDVEYIKPTVPFKSLAKRFFSSKEYQALINLPSSEQRRAFFRFWTHKEAFIKVLGEGLFHFMKKFEIEFTPSSTLLFLENLTLPSNQYSFHDLEFSRAYSATLAIEGQCEVMKYLQWNDELFEKCK